MFQWLCKGTPAKRRTFRACLGGWALDALDVQRFGLVISALVASWHVSRTEAGLIGSVTLLTSAVGGWLGGALAGRIGRVRALRVTVLWPPWPRSPARSRNPSSSFLLRRGCKASAPSGRLASC